MRLHHLLCVLAVLALGGMYGAASAADVLTKQSGPWSAKETWDAGHMPQKGDRVVIRAGHTILYDVESTEVLRLLQIAGTLDFARDKNTRLDAGLITIIASEEPSENGFDCHASPKLAAEGKSRPALLVGQPGSPIPGKFQALIRLSYVEGMDKETCPALVDCGGRLELHGEPMRQTWVKLKKEAAVGATTVIVMESLDGWKAGDHIVVSCTNRPRGGFRRGGGEGAPEGVQNEERCVVSIGERDASGGYPLVLDKPLAYSHYADEAEGFQGEVANLTRNVIIESAEPDGVRGHTMFHKYSSGSISYAEFRHLGKQDVLGKYSIHFHQCGTTMRGSSVIGASVWDSKNRWITVHGTDALVIRDCVGFKSIGHGYFLEDGTETNTIFDHNAAFCAKPGKPLAKQMLPFDGNLGAGFWWANCQNSFTRNVAVDCGEYGYRFEVLKTADFDPVQDIRQADGTTKKQDIRIMPFIRFEDNEAHSFKNFCMNLRGVPKFGGGQSMPGNDPTLLREANEAQPVPGQPFWIRNFRAWEANYSLHLGTTGVLVDGLNSYRNDVAIWRSIMDGSGFRRLVSREMRVNDIHNPISTGPLQEPKSEGENHDRRRSSGGVSSFKDVTPPVTIITSAMREKNQIHVRGSVADSSDIRQVTVNGQQAKSTRGSFAEWEIMLDAPAGEQVEISASAVDSLGHTETTPHRVRLDQTERGFALVLPAVEQAALAPVK